MNATFGSTVSCLDKATVNDWVSDLDILAIAMDTGASADDLRSVRAQVRRVAPNLSTSEMHALLREVAKAPRTKLAKLDELLDEKSGGIVRIVDPNGYGVPRNEDNTYTLTVEGRYTVSYTSGPDAHLTYEGPQRPVIFRLANVKDSLSPEETRDEFSRLRLLYPSWQQGNQWAPFRPAKLPANAVGNRRQRRARAKQAKRESAGC